MNDAIWWYDTFHYLCYCFLTFCKKFVFNQNKWKFFVVYRKFFPYSFFIIIYQLFIKKLIIYFLSLFSLSIFSYFKISVWTELQTKKQDNNSKGFLTKFRGAAIMGSLTAASLTWLSAFVCLLLLSCCNVKADDDAFSCPNGKFCAHTFFC